MAAILHHVTSCGCHLILRRQSGGSRRYRVFEWSGSRSAIFVGGNLCGAIGTYVRKYYMYHSECQELKNNPNP